MAFNSSLTIGANNDSYTVTLRDGCTMVQGSVPVSHFSALAAIEPGAVMSSQLSRMLGCTLAWGKPAAVMKLLKEVRAERDRPGMDPMLRWLAIGERGASSDAIAYHLRGCAFDIQVHDHKAYPHDPDDFQRCMKLLHDVPGLDTDLHLMASVSPVWAEFVAAWPHLVVLFQSEAPANWSDDDCDGWMGPKLYERMKEVISAGEKRERAHG